MDPSAYDRGGRRCGRDCSGYRSIGGYIWRDNAYKDGWYSRTPGSYKDPDDPTSTELIKLEDVEEGRVGTIVYLRQWYYDPEHVNTDNKLHDASFGDHWFPVPAAGYGNDRDQRDFYYTSTVTKAKTASGKPVDATTSSTSCPCACS